MTVAATIRQQVGSRAFVMMGSRLILEDERSILFEIRGCPKINKARITLEPTDTYRVEFFKIARRGLDVTTVADHEGVYADSLRPLIEKQTGLYLSL
jgi:hypothetical protein